MSSEISAASQEPIFDDPDVLAAFYGFNTLEKMASRMSYGARVLAIGSGLADFVKTMALLRADTSWTSIDENYSEPSTLYAAQNYATTNVEFLPRDIRMFQDEFSDESFDYIYFYNNPASQEAQSLETVRASVDVLPDFLTPKGELYVAPVDKDLEDLPSYDKENGRIVIFKTPRPVIRSEETTPPRPHQVYEEHWDALVLTDEQAKKLKMIGAGVVAVASVMATAWIRRK